MKQYLWDFLFDELFLAEEGQSVLNSATKGEVLEINLLRDYFEETAIRCREKINNLQTKDFVGNLPNMLHDDTVLQLCLIYSLGIQENSLLSKELIIQLESEVCNYFSEYRSFAKRFAFENYSMMNQIAVA